MAIAFLGLGSNLGDRGAHLERALDALRQTAGVDVLTMSRVYETPPVGPQNQGPFLNAAARLETTLGPRDLLRVLLAIERRLGRTPRRWRRDWGPREIDLDLLLYNNQSFDQPGLRVPHPRLHERWFVLKPLSDLAPGQMHPTLGRSVAELLSSLPPTPTHLPPSPKAADANPPAAPGDSQKNAKSENPESEI